MPLDEQRLESLLGTVSEQESAACASVVVTGWVVLLWRLFVRTNVCGVGHCSLLLVRLDNICVKRTRWVIAGWVWGTRRCPLCDEG